MSQGLLFERVAKPTDWVAQEPPSLDGIQRVWMDTETTGKVPHRDKPVGTSIILPDGRAFYLPWRHRGGGNLCEETVRRWHERELRGKDICFLNAKFDVRMYLNWGISLEEQGNKVHDVAFQAALLNEHRRRFNLGELAMDVLQLRKADLDESKNHIHEMHAGEVGPYAEQDARLVKLLDEKQMKQIVAEDLTRVLDLEDWVIYAVVEMEKNAARLDVEKLELWRVQARDLYQQAILKIWRETGMRVNPDSSIEMERLFHHLKLEFPKTASGNPSFEGQFLEKVEHPIVQLALRARRLNSLLSKYLDKYAKALDGDLLRFQLHQLRGGEYGTITGRFASANVNIQQVMKVGKQIKKLGPDFIIRELFIPEDGMLWCSSDAKQIEFRLFAHYADSDRLNRAYRENPDIDFHDVVKNLIQRSLPNCDRDKAKGGNFGKLYGMGLEKAADQLGLSLDEAEDFIETYDREFPEAKRLMNQCMNVAQRRGYVKTYFGRRGRFEEKRGFHKALNKVIQGTAADVNKLKLGEVYYHRKELGIHKLRLTVHDEIDCDVPDVETARRVHELLDRQSVPFRVPILWDNKTGKNWRDCA